ncbi:hypothetical protein DPMN_141944 [Dreissena polymorpha]|uniref:Uncharacterized protein n=1 Tax=Dreissena polymorpha TaxID=45954 RepID=A0A9D4JLR4_DREPO|nr:hypothetical protein DPMN_141944 [Dreissena polymorpha]
MIGFSVSFHASNYDQKEHADRGARVGNFLGPALVDRLRFDNVPGGRFWYNA